MIPLSAVYPEKNIDSSLRGENKSNMANRAFIIQPVRDFSARGVGIGIHALYRFRKIGVLVCLAVLCALFPVCTAAQISLSVQKASYAEVLAEIERQVPATFSYESSLFDGLPPLTVRMANLSLADCLDRLFAGGPVEYRISGETIILKRKPRERIVRGFVRDKDTGEPLVGASVYEPDGRQGVASNSEGYFHLKLSPDDGHSFYFSYIGYRSRLVRLPASERDTVLEVALVPSASLEEVVVTVSDGPGESVRSLSMGTFRMDRQTLRRLPVLFGEADVVKTLQLTPGVASGTEGLSGLLVRGGGADENLFLIDGNPVYQVSHLGGIFSAFNPEAVHEVAFYKAGFPARYGGRLSSIVDVSAEEGDLKEYHGSASIGLIAGNIRFEGPLVKDRTSFHFSIRRTWLDALSAPAFAIYNRTQKKYGQHTNLRYAFHDLNLKLVHYFTPRSKLYLTVYNGNDVLKIGQKSFPGKNSDESYENKSRFSVRWGNVSALAGWNRVYNEKLSGRVEAAFTRFGSNFRRSDTNRRGEEGTDAYVMEQSGIRGYQGICDFSLRSVFDYFPSDRQQFRFGGEYFAHAVSPESGIPAEWAHETALFAEDNWSVFPFLRLRAGVRLGLFGARKTRYWTAEPRFSLRWLICRPLSFKASYSRMSQGVQRVNNTFLDLPIDAWMPATERLKPRVSDQYSAGLYYAPAPEWEVSAEGYYKRMAHLLEYKDQYFLLPSSAAWEEKLTVGRGRAYGVEWLVRKQAGRLTGWFGYGLSWSDRRFAELNKGKPFPDRYDNRHKLNIVGMYKLSERVELSCAWSYASGNHVTLSLENYEGIGGPEEQPSPWHSYVPQIDMYEDRNNYQLPAYHRMDVGLKIYRPQKKGRMGIWQVSVYNVYCRMNPFMVYKDWKAIRSTTAEGESSYKFVPVFKHVGFMPVVPSVSYTYQF